MQASHNDKKTVEQKEPGLQQALQAKTCHLIQPMLGTCASSKPLDRVSSCSSSSSCADDVVQQQQHGALPVWMSIFSQLPPHSSARTVGMMKAMMQTYPGTVGRSTHTSNSTSAHC